VSLFSELNVGSDVLLLHISLFDVVLTYLHLLYTESY
jgi:hypothetical protein